MAVTVEQVQQLLGQKELRILELEIMLQESHIQNQKLQELSLALETQDNQVVKFPKEVEQEISNGMGSTQ